jgi:hypothetical protein
MNLHLYRPACQRKPAMRQRSLYDFVDRYRFKLEFEFAGFELRHFPGFFHEPV